MKQIICIVLSIFMFTVLTGCDSDKNTIIEEEIAKPVGILELQDETYPLLLEYIGVVSQRELVRIGLAQRDKSKVEVGMPVKVRGGDEVGVGEVTYIHLVPDYQTLTYGVEISLEKNNFSIGETLKISIEIGEEKGIRIPIQSILTSNYDYVFIVEDGKAEKKQIEILEVRGSEVMVKGLTANEKLILQGMKQVKSGDPVIIVR